MYQENNAVFSNNGVCFVCYKQSPVFLLTRYLFFTFI
jgi:hypothetical protein